MNPAIAENSTATMGTADNRPRIVVNADDFGYNEEVNGAIVHCFQEGLVSSASLMANRPGSDQAAALVHEHGLHGRIGIHLNLSDGRPMLPATREVQELCDGQRLRWTRNGRLFLSRRLRSAIYAEWEAQVKYCLECGISPTHVDSHYHVHTEPCCLSITIALAKRFGIRHVRLARNFGGGRGAVRALYKSLVNWRLRRQGFAQAWFFGDLIDVAQRWRSSGWLPRGPGECMVHPRAWAETPGKATADDTLLRSDCWEQFRSHITLVSYGEL